jgi:hypothetical protein
MKTQVFLLILVTGWLTGWAKTTGQERGKQDFRESVRLFTDRTMFVTGEFVQFSAWHKTKKDSSGTILYLEMITSDGVKIAAGKYRFDQGLASGCLKIPEDLLTGIYYIRGYTLFMRNYGPLAYDYLPVKVINPNKTDILASGNEAPFPETPDSINDGLFQLSTDKEHYGKRESAGITIRMMMPEAARMDGMCLSVIPANTAELSGIIEMKPKNEKSVPLQQYYAETGGIPLTGTIVDKDMVKPAPDHVITLSVMGHKDFSAYRTRGDGRFFFTLPEDQGSRDIFLSAADISGHTSTLLIDNDYCTIPVRLYNPEFSLSEKEKEVAFRLSVNKEVSDQYDELNTVAEVDSLKDQIKPFYGQPTETLIMDKFIQLPTLEEYFNELPLEVKVRERKGGKYFKFLSTNASMIVNDPLVLVDWVVIGDIGKILALSPQKILKIEIVDKPYVKGNLTYGGIISIISRQGDFAGIDLPGSGIFVKYDLLTPCPQAGNYVPLAGHHPDSRNTLLWLPDLRPETESRITFVTPDTPGQYIILLRGVSPDGRVVRRSLSFDVN